MFLILFVYFISAPHSMADSGLPCSLDETKQYSSTDRDHRAMPVHTSQRFRQSDFIETSGYDSLKKELERSDGNPIVVIHGEHRY